MFHKHNFSLFFEFTYFIFVYLFQRIFNFVWIVVSLFIGAVILGKVIYQFINSVLFYLIGPLCHYDTNTVSFRAGS